MRIDKKARSLIYSALRDLAIVSGNPHPIENASRTDMTLDCRTRSELRSASREAPAHIAAG
jgi:hypothetical protein